MSWRSEDGPNEYDVVNNQNYEQQIQGPWIFS